MACVCPCPLRARALSHAPSSEGTSTQTGTKSSGTAQPSARPTSPRSTVSDPLGIPWLAQPNQPGIRIRMHTPEHCDLYMVVSNFVLVLKKPTRFKWLQNVSKEPCQQVLVSNHANKYLDLPLLHKPASRKSTTLRPSICRDVSGSLPWLPCFFPSARRLSLQKKRGQPYMF